MRRRLGAIRAQIREDWEAVGRPPWYVWPFLVFPLFLSNYWLGSATVAFAVGITSLVAAIATGWGWGYVCAVASFALAGWAFWLAFGEFDDRERSDSL